MSAIRSREYDIAIDLSGWTGGNFVRILIRLAQFKLIIWGILHLLDCQQWTIGLAIIHCSQIQ